MSDILSQDEIDALLAAAPNIQKAAEESAPAAMPEEPMEAVEPAPAPDAPSMDFPDLDGIPEPQAPDADFSEMTYEQSGDMDFIEAGRRGFGTEGELPREHDTRQEYLKNKVRPAMFGTLQTGEAAVEATSLELVLDTGLEVRCELGRAKRRIKDILEMGPGSVIELNKLAGEAVDMLVNDRFFSKGEVVVIDQNFGVRVTDILGIEERIEILN